MPRNLPAINYLRFIGYSITNVNAGAGTATLTGTYTVGNAVGPVLTDEAAGANGSSVSIAVTAVQTFSAALVALRNAALAQEGLSIGSGDQGFF